jgi:hypothetical protein
VNKSSLDKTWGNYCNDIGSSIQVVNRWLNQWFGAESQLPPGEPPSLPAGKYAVIYADPPWQYSKMVNA